MKISEYLIYLMENLLGTYSRKISNDHNILTNIFDSFIFNNIYLLPTQIYLPYTPQCFFFHFPGNASIIRNK